MSDPATIATPVDPTVATTFAAATAFLYSAHSPTQLGTVPKAIDPTRSAVLRGRVVDRDNAALSGVCISALDHPEFGRTMTREDGMFDLAVNGGRRVVVAYEKRGYLSAHRSMATPWQDHVWLPDVALIEADAGVTPIDLGTTNHLQLVRGSLVTDSAGSRRAILLVLPGTQAKMLLPDGSTRAPKSLSVRVTEYSVGEGGPNAMPAELPASSGYTCAVEFNADEAIAAGAREVRFEPPLVAYIENFLDFPIGMPVPAGAYDRSSGSWISSSNGLVVRVTAVSGGRAAVDIDGDGIAEDGAALAALGISDDERKQLAALFVSGQSLWRVPVDHFSPHDWNWPRQPPADAERPDLQVKDERERRDSCTVPGSIIELENQTLRKQFGVVGTPFSMNYSSSRTRGRRDGYSLDISVTGRAVPASLVGVELEVFVAGRRTTQQFPPVPGQTYTLSWDGKDAYGRELQGAAPIAVRLGYVYPAVYGEPADIERAFAAFSRSALTPNPTREHITIWREWRGAIGAWVTPGTAGLGGWSFDIHHSYDPAGRVLYRGDGRRQSGEGMGGVLRRLATAGAGLPVAVAVAGDGAVYLVDGESLIRRIARDGTDAIVAGGGASEGDGILATSARLSGVSAIALARDGSFYVAERESERIRQVVPDGAIRTVAGGGVSNEDGVPAGQARLGKPLGLAVGPDESLFIATDTGRVRRLAPDGTLDTAAGGGPDARDGVQASRARLDQPRGVAVGPDGTLFIADSGSHRVRSVGADGVIRTVAGTGSPGFDPSNDGLPATTALLDRPEGVAVAPDGSLYIADSGNRRIRRVGVDGVITTIVGAGPGAGSRDDGVPATAAELVWPVAAASAPDGTLYVVDLEANRLATVTSPLPGFSGSDLVVSSDDGSELFVFDATGRHLRTVDSLTGSLRYGFHYDATQRLTEIVDIDKNVTAIERNSSGAAVAIVGPYGHRTALTVGAPGYLTKVKNPAGETLHFEYSLDGLMTRAVDPLGNDHSFAYDDTGRLVEEHTPAGGSLMLSRLATGASVTVRTVSAMLREESFRRDTIAATRELRSVRCCGQAPAKDDVAPDGTTVSQLATGTTIRRELRPDPRFGMQAPFVGRATRRRPSGHTLDTAATRTLEPPGARTAERVVGTVTVNGRTSRVVYDIPTRLLTGTTPTGRTIAIGLDARGRPVSHTAFGGLSARVRYDARGRVDHVTLGAGTNARSFTIDYNTEGLPAQTEDPLKRVTRFKYDAADRLTRQTLPGSRVVSFEHDLNGQVKSITPPGRPAHVFKYSEAGLVIGYEPPDVPGWASTAIGYTYDADQRLVAIHRPDGGVLSLDYDTSGRLAFVTTPASRISYTHDPTSGLLTEAATPSVRLSYEHDGDIVVKETWSGVVFASVGHTYAEDDAPIKQNVNGQYEIAVSYDDDGLVMTAGELTLQRDAETGSVSTSVLGRIEQHWERTPFGELKEHEASLDGQKLYEVRYERDRLGRIVSREESMTGAPLLVHKYEYDIAGRLSRVSRDGLVAAEYAYDANGNRLTVDRGGVLTNAQYDDQDRLLAEGDTVYDYSATGELRAMTTATSSTSYKFDGLGNLVEVALPTGTTIGYLVDPFGRRVAKTVDGTTVQRFVYDGLLRPIAELDDVGAVVTRFVYATQLNVPDYVVKGPRTYDLITDERGSPRLVIDVDSGVVAQQMAFDEFGRIIRDTSPGFQPFGFAGGLYDAQTDLVLFGTRNYDSTVGRWITKDPLGFASDEWNLYSYASNDPVNFIDPYGYQRFDPSHPHCVALARKLQNVFQDLQRRIGEFLGNPLDLPWRCPGDEVGHGLSQWAHLAQVMRVAASYNHYYDRYWKECGGPPPPPPLVAAGPAPSPATSSSGGNAALAAGAAVGTIGAGYVIYRVVRFLPSVAPPLWPTIVPNLVVP